jgi:TPR repeat protein
MSLLLAWVASGGANERSLGLQKRVARAEHSDPVAQVYLGLSFDLGEGVAQDPATAAQWYRKAAEQDLARAQLYLGAAYLKGRGVPEDSVSAFMWLDLAAAQLTDEDRELAEGLREQARRGMASSEITAAEWMAQRWLRAHRAYEREDETSPP